MKRIYTIVMAAATCLSMASCGGNGAAKSAEGDAAADNKLPIGLQLYSIRDDMAKDFKGTLQKVKDMGYDGVEFAGLYDNTPEQVKAMCDEIGLVPVSAHVPLADMLADIDKVIADYKAIGCQYIVVPYVTEERRPGGELFMQMIDEIRTIGQKVKDAGMTLLYHNHDFEFTKLEDGQYGLDYLYANVPADLLQTELDECWVKYSGEDPVAYLKKYAGRSPLVHIKDFYAEGKQEGDPYALIGLNEGEQKKAGTFEFRPLGEGLQDIPAIIKAAEESGSKWLIVEQDDPSMGKTPMECITMSINYLKDNYINCSADCSTEDCAACPESKSCEGCPEAK